MTCIARNNFPSGDFPSGTRMKIAKRRVRTVRDQRGVLRIFEKGSSLPFPLKRCFVISHVPKGKTRAEHEASCDQFLAVLAGTCRLTIRKGGKEAAMTLSRQTKGALVRNGTWLRLDRFSAGTIVLVCAREMFRRKRGVWR